MDLCSWQGNGWVETGSGDQGNSLAASVDVARGGIFSMKAIMNHRASSLGAFAVAAALGCLASTANALPALQVDFLGGSYDVADESVVTTEENFTLYTYATPTGNLSANDILSDTFKLSIALLPQVGPDAVNLGSFTYSIGGGPTVTVDVTDDMTYGNPPLESLVEKDPGDLSPHGVFPTFFYEVPFQFIANQTSTGYNVQDDPGLGPDDAGSDMFYRAFDFDVTGLDVGVDLHFDLYNTKLAKKSQTDIDADLFAPFSHDGFTQRDGDDGGGGGGGGDGETAVPEPISAFTSLMGMGALVVATRRRRPRK